MKQTEAAVEITPANGNGKKLRVSRSQLHFASPHVWSKRLTDGIALLEVINNSEKWHTNKDDQEKVCLHHISNNRFARRSDLCWYLKKLKKLQVAPSSVSVADKNGWTAAHYLACNYAALAGENGRRCFPDFLAFCPTFGSSTASPNPLHLLCHAMEPITLHPILEGYLSVSKDVASLCRGKDAYLRYPLHYSCANSNVEDIIQSLNIYFRYSEKNAWGLMATHDDDRCTPSELLWQRNKTWRSMLVNLKLPIQGALSDILGHLRSKSAQSSSMARSTNLGLDRSVAELRELLLHCPSVAHAQRKKLNMKDLNARFNKKVADSKARAAGCCEKLYTGDFCQRRQIFADESGREAKVLPVSAVGGTSSRSIVPGQQLSYVHQTDHQSLESDGVAMRDAHFYGVHTITRVTILALPQC